MTFGRSAAWRKLLVGSTSQVAGRLLLSLVRLAAALLILRWSGVEQFGAYVLLLTFLAFAEWLVDFGQTDIVVREVNRDPHAGEPLLAALKRLRLAQALILMPLLPAGIAMAGYPTDLVIAGALGSATLPVLALALVARARLRATMHMGRDILAELASGAVLLLATAASCRTGAGTVGLMAAYLASRLAWALAAAILAREVPRFASTAMRGEHSFTPRWLFRESLPLGAIGLLVGIYDGMAPIVLGYLGDLEQVAIYGIVTRCAVPALLVVQALGTAFFPLLTQAWATDRELLATVQHMAFDAALLLSVGFVCVLIGAADFIMATVSPGQPEHVLAGRALALQAMGLVVVARTMSTAMVPMIVVAGWQSRAAWLTAVSLTAQLLGLFAMVPSYGALGAVLTCLVVEVLTSVLGIGWLAWRASGVAPAWSVPLRLLGSGMLAVTVVAFSPIAGSLVGGLAAGAGFMGLALASQAISAVRLRSFATTLARRSELRADPPSAPT